MAVNFKVSADDGLLIREIARRAHKTVYKDYAKTVQSPQYTMMDLCAAHNTCPLRLQELLEARDAEFAHDILGIRKYICRTTGHLNELFVPRFAKPD